MRHVTLRDSLWLVVALVILLTHQFMLGAGSPKQMVCAAEQQKQVKGEVVEADLFKYCLCEKCCGASNPDGKTATGKDAKKHLDGVAADPKVLPYGQRLWIPDIGEKVVDDTGTRMKVEAKAPIKVCVRVKDHAEVVKFGHKRVKIVILED